MKKDMDSRRNWILVKKLWLGCILAAMLSVSVSVQAEGLDRIDTEDSTEVVADMQDSDAVLLAKQIEQLPDSSQLDAEFSALEEESVMIVEEVERQRAEARRSKIWGAVIIVLVIGIFSMGVVSTRESKKAEDADSAEEKGFRKKLGRQKEKGKEDAKEEMEIENIL